MIFSRLKTGKPKKAISFIVAVALICNGLFVFFPQDVAEAATQNAYRWRNDDGTEAAASWAAAENTSVTNVVKSESKRLRFGMANDGSYATADLTVEYESIGTTAVEEDKLVGFIDAGTYVYSVWDAYEVLIYKHNASTGAVVDTFAPTDLWIPTDAALDPDGSYLYFTAESATNAVLARVALSNFDTYSTLSLGALSSGYEASAVDVDSAGNYAYVARDDVGDPYSTAVYKVNLTTFTSSGSTSWDYWEYGWMTLDGVIDSGDDFLYYRMYGDGGNPGTYLIIRIELADFATGPDDILVLDSYGYYVSDYLTIDSAGTYIYVASRSGSAGYVTKVQASDLTVVGSPYELPNSSDDPEWLGIDDTNNFLYITDRTGGLIITEIDLSDFTYENELSVASSFRGSVIGFTDGANDALYLGGALDDYETYFAKIDTTRDQSDMEYALRLEYGAKSTTCGAIGAWTAVAASDSGSEHWAMKASDNITNGATTTNVGSGVTDGETSFVSGYIMDTASTTPAVTLATDEFTEVEYSIAPTSDATGGGNYCFRLTDGGIATALTFSNYAEASVYSGTSNVQNAYRWRNDDGTETTATWAAAENTALTNLAKGTTKRLRLGTSAGSAQAGTMSIIDESEAIASDQNYATEAIVDDGTYLYAVWSDWNSPSYISVTRIQKSDLTILNQYDFPTNIRGGAWGAAIDPAGDYLYFNATNSTAGQTVAVKFNLSTFNTYSTLSLGSSGSYHAHSLDMDSTGDYLYVAVNGLTSTTNGTIYKVDLDTFTTSDSRTLAYGTYGNYFTSGDIDDADDYLYYATNRVGSTTLGRLIKMDLSNFAGAAIDVENLYSYGTQYYPRGSLLVDSSGDYLYFAMLSGIYGVGKVTTSTLTFTHYTPLTGRVGTPYWPTPMAIDDVNEYLYFTDYNYESDMKLYAVDLRNFTIADSLSLGIAATSMSAAYVDETNGHIYTAGFGGSGTAADFQKIGLKTRYSVQPRLEYGRKNTFCSAISDWTQVPATDAGSEHWSMSDSANITNDEATTNVAAGITDGNTTFKAGHVMDTASTTSAIELAGDEFTEVEYSIKATSDAVDGADYCFRLTDAGTPDDFYFRDYGEAGLSGGEGYTTQIQMSLARYKVNQTNVAFSLTFNYSESSDGTLTVTFPVGFTVTAAATDAGSSDCLTSFGFTSSTLTATETGCTGAITIGGASVTNPSTPGAYTISFTGSGGEGEVYIMDDDQVSITGDVDPSLSFNVGTSAACDGTFVGNGGTLALGTIDVGTVTTSDVGGVSHVCTRVSTNATDGAVVTARSLYGALTSASTPADTIASSTATLAPGTAGYGICVGSGVSHTGKDTTVPVGADPAASAPFASSCDTSNHNVGGLTTNAQDLWVISGASQNAFARVFVKASISPTTPAHGDYTDTLTFIATATY